MIQGAIVLILLLIFIIQNNVPTRFEYFTAQFQLPLGVAMLLAAIAGALVMALVGSVRMVQMSWTIRDRKSTRLNSSHVAISYAVFCLKKKNKQYYSSRSLSVCEC